MRTILLSALVPIVLFSASVAAQDLYSGVAPVAGQGEAERRSATPDALINVLQKQSGRWEIPRDPALDAALADPGRMLVAFQYREEEILRPDGDTEKQWLLVASFLPSAIDSLVREMRLPRWRTEREPVVAWVLVEEGGERELMPMEYRDAWDGMQRIAERRGLNLAWPELDEELKAALDLQLIWGGYTDQLLADGASSDGIVIVAARREGPEWNLRWNWEDGDGGAAWRTRATDLVQALTEGTHELVNHVAAAQTIGPAGLVATRSELLISGLESGDEYARVLNYLEGLSLVDAVTVLGADPGGVRLGLSLNADRDYLDEAFRSDGLLEPAERPGEYRIRRLAAPDS